MNRQNQWLFEAPASFEAASYTLSEYYSNSEWEGERGLQEASPYGLGEKEWEQVPISSPRGQSIRETIAGFSRYSNAIPPQEKVKIARIAQMIVQSYRSGQPIRTVRLVGHADRDVQRGANFEKKISGDRALAVQQALIRTINNHAISSQIGWQRVPTGASQLIVKNPTAEQARSRNRRVEILLSISCGSLPIYSSLMSRSMLNSAIQLCGAPPVPTCRHPAPLQIATVNAAGIKFDVQVSAVAFNPFPRGVVQQIKSSTQQSVSKLRFSNHRIGVLQGCPAPIFVPAWKYEAALGFSGSLTPSDWEFGFIQNVQASRIIHVYSSGGGQMCSLQRVLDTLPGSSLPWCDSTNGLVGLDANNNAILEDSPFTIAQVKHPQKPSQELVQVCMDHVFRIWVAVRKRGNPPGKLILLAFKEIELKRTWERKLSADPLDLSAWIAFGGQKETRQLPGGAPNMPAPIVSGPTANSQASNCFQSVTGQKCETENLPQFMGDCVVGTDCPTVNQRRSVIPMVARRRS